jgi:hypothetical protein
MRKFLTTSLTALFLGAFFLGKTWAYDSGAYYVDVLDEMGLDAHREIEETPRLEDWLEEFLVREGVAEEEPAEDLSGDTEESSDIEEDPAAATSSESSQDNTSALPDLSTWFRKTNSKSSSDWALFLATDSSVDLSSQDSILICNTSFSTEDFSCDRSGVTSTNLSIQKVADLHQGGAVQVGLGVEDGSRLLVIPEIVLLVPSYRSTLSPFLKTYSDSLGFSFDYDLEDQKTPGIVDFLKSWSFETFVYVAAFTLFILVFKGTLVTLARNPKEFLKIETYLKPLNCLVNFLRKYRWISAYGLILWAVGIAGFLFAVMFKDRGGLDAGYLVSFAVDSLKPGNVHVYVKHFNRTRLAFYGLMGAGALLFALHFLSDFYDLIVLSLKKIFTSPSEATHVNIAFLKGALLFLLTLGTLLSLVLPLPGSLSFLSILLLVVFYTSFLLYRTSYKLVLKEKIIAVAVLAGTVSLGLLLNFISSTQVPPTRYQELIGVPDKVVMLPYRKEHSEEVLFDPMVLEDFDHSLFIDDYLIYHPSFTSIANKPLTGEVDLGGNSLIMGMDTDSYAKLLLQNESFRSTASSPSVSKNLLIPDFERDYGAEYSLELGIACSTEGEPGTLSLHTHHLDENGELKTEENEVLHFPGCFEGDRYVYEVPVDLGTVLSGPTLLSLEGLSSGLELIRFDFLKDSDAVGGTYVRAPADRHEVFIANISSVSPALTVYTYGLPAEHVVTYEGGFDLGSEATALKEAGLVDNPFIIWSLDEGVVIRNELVEDF